MSYRSSRYNINGYRSQPVSNRSSLYLSDYSTSSYGLSSDVTDFDRQFKRLLERTEKFTNRVERLQTTSSATTKGFRYLDRTVTGRQRDRVSLYDKLIDPDPISTEEEWKRYLDRGCLVEKAVEQLRRQYRYPKSVFEYSPESRSPYSYKSSPNTKLVSNPRTPTDRHGRKVRDKGMEQLEKNIIKHSSAVLLHNIEDSAVVSSPKETRKNEQAKALEVLAEEDEPAHSPEKAQTSNSIKNLRNEILSTNTTTEQERNGFIPSKPLEKEESEEHKRKNSWRSRKTQQETTAETKIKNDKEQNEKPKQTLEDEEPEKKVSKTHKLFDSIKSSAKKRNKNKGKNESKNEKLEKNAEQSETLEQQNNEANRREHVSGKARPTTMYDLDLNDEVNETPTKQKKDSNRNSLFLDDDAVHKSKSSSSFHEYIPGHNVPLKERLRRKQMDQNNKASSENQFNSVIMPDRSLAQRASNIIRSKYHGNDKDEPSSPTTKTESNKGNSLTSKFFRRFMGGDKESEKEKAKDETTASVRKKKESGHNENDRNDEKSSPRQTLRSEESNFKELLKTSDKNFDESRLKHNEKEAKDTPLSNGTSDYDERTNKTTANNSQQSEAVVYRRRKNRDKPKEDPPPVNDPPRKFPAVVEEEIVPTTKRAEELRLNFRSPVRSIDKVEEDLMEEETVRQSVNLTDDVFDCLQQLDAAEEDTKVNSGVSVDDPMLETLETSVEPSNDLTHFIVPIEEENTLRMQQIDHMFDEIESINENMYQELLNLTKQETEGEMANKASNTTGSQQRNLQYEPTQTKVPKMKILQSDLMGTERFTATKESWNTKATRKLSRTKSYDSGNDEKPGSSSRGLVRRNSESHERPASLMGINDDAIKHTNKHFDEFSGENQLQTLENNEDLPTSQKVERNLSEVEKTREDVDKMLENCESIDKINNSMSEANKLDNTVPTTTRETSTIEENSVHAEDMFGVDEILETARQITALMEQTQVNSTSEETTTPTISTSSTNIELDTFIKTESSLTSQEVETVVFSVSEPQSPFSSEDQTVSISKSDENEASTLHSSELQTLAGSKDSSNLDKNNNRQSTGEINTANAISEVTNTSEDVSSSSTNQQVSSAAADSIMANDESLCKNDTASDSHETNTSKTLDIVSSQGMANQLPLQQNINALSIQVPDMTEQKPSELPSPSKSEYVTPPLTPSDIQKTFSSTIESIKDENNNGVLPTDEQKPEGVPQITNSSVPQQQENTPELTASPFTFSIQRSKTNPQKHPSYLEKCQSHVGIFSLNKVPSVEANLNSPTLSYPHKPSSTNDVRQDHNSLFRLNRVASATRLNTLESMKPDSDTSFKLVKVASSTKLSLLPTPDIILSKKEEKKAISDVAENKGTEKESDVIKLNDEINTQTADNVHIKTVMLTEPLLTAESSLIENKSDDFSKQNPAELNSTVGESVQTDNVEQDIHSSEPLLMTAPTNIHNATEVTPKQTSVESNVTLTENVHNDVAGKQPAPLLAAKSTTIENNCEFACKETSVKTSLANAESVQNDTYAQGNEPSDNVYLNGTVYVNDQENDKSSSSKSSSSTLRAHSRNLSNGSTLSPPFSGSEDDNRTIKRDGRSVLEKQLSLKEHRLQKLQRGGTVETSFSDEETRRSGVEFSTVSSLADISDASIELNLSRNKRYSHSKKDLQNIGIESSSSESDVPLMKTSGQRINDKLNMLYRIKKEAEKTKTSLTTNDKIPPFVVKDYTRKWHSSGENDFDKSERRKRLTRRNNFRSVDEF